jgi:hypothetical protein
MNTVQISMNRASSSAPTIGAEKTSRAMTWTKGSATMVTSIARLPQRKIQRRGSRARSSA